LCAFEGTGGENQSLDFMRKRIEIKSAYPSAYDNGRYRIRTCDLTGVIVLEKPYITQKSAICHPLVQLLV